MSTPSPQSLGKVAVLFGGDSAEREISILSGSAVLAALRDKGVDAHAFDPAERDLWELKRDGFDRAFIALHGRGGEDGTLQGALECLRIPYTGSGVMASAIGMDKWRTKMVWLSAGLPTPRYKLLHAGSDFRAVAEALGLPLFVKPAREGSSVGAARVDTLAELAPAYEAAARCDPLVLAEQFITGQELTAPFLGDMALPLIRIEAPRGNYDYQNKYFTDAVKYHCPSGLDADLEQDIQALVMQAARLIDCRGWGRADLMLGDDGRPWLLEINTAPGMTSHSLVPMAARAVGIEFGELCLHILESAHLG
jgi:D-alanine-D-alanine ligase